MLLCRSVRRFSLTVPPFLLCINPRLTSRIPASSGEGDTDAGKFRAVVVIGTLIVALLLDGSAAASCDVRSTAGTCCDDITGRRRHDVVTDRTWAWHNVGFLACRPSCRVRRGAGACDITGAQVRVVCVGGTVFGCIRRLS
jgi:hypothetical protein